jgi:hypothetical protein
MTRAGLALASALVFTAIPVSVAADALPSGEHALGNTVIEPAYDDSGAGIVYLLTPVRLAPLNPTQPINGVNSNAVAPLFLVVYPPGTPGTFNCMGNPGNCPDHDGAIAGVATSVMPAVYGTSAAAVPGHDHLVGLPRTGDFNAAWHVYVELFTSTSAVHHITTLNQLETAWASGQLLQLDSGITFLCPVVSAQAYASGRPVG